MSCGWSSSAEGLCGSGAQSCASLLNAAVVSAILAVMRWMSRGRRPAAVVCRRITSSSAAYASASRSSVATATRNASRVSGGGPSSTRARNSASARLLSFAAGVRPIGPGLNFTQEQPLAPWKLKVR